MIKYIDLFAGVGGIRLGVSQALSKNGIEARCVLSSEINEKACETYQLNFGEHPSGDVKLIEEVEPFDLLLGGFPCQPFSYAGKRMGFGDTRGTLFFEIERLLEKYRPKAFLLENVRGLYTHDEGRTFKTIMDKLHGLGYGTYDLLQNSSNFGVPQNRVRLYIVGILGATPEMGLVTDLGAADSHRYKQNSLELSLFDEKPRCRVGDVLEPEVDEKYYCSDRFQQMLHEAVGDDLSVLHGYRLIDYRGGQSLHSWELGMKGKCSDAEIRFMNALIQNRRKPIFGKEQDGKKLTLEQIKTFYTAPDIEDVIASLLEKRYLQVNEDGKYNPVCGNMSFEVFKFLDPESISVTLTSSDANRLGVIQHNRARHITPRECARLQGFPDTFKLHPADTWSYKQFGNSVSVPVVKAVFDEFLKNNISLLEWLQS
ncbi:MAG: DNA (cytosine-5-)-methyltransferase [Prevotella sp.]|nr:DNA (cytosine-5-)-methyltransferase [Prevotella sp.]